MPIYEYSCGQCGLAFEELVIRRSDENEVKCPKCGSRRAERLVSRPAAARIGGGGGGFSPGPSCGPIG